MHVEHSSAHTERLTGHLRGFAPPQIAYTAISGPAIAVELQQQLQQRPTRAATRNVPLDHSYVPHSGAVAAVPRPSSSGGRRRGGMGTAAGA
eukprot:612990-Prymnesium_polylepis.1